MRVVHLRRGAALIRRGCASQASFIGGLIITLLVVPVLVRTAHQLSATTPVKPKPSLVRVCKGNERAPESLSQVDSVFAAPGSVRMEHGAEVVPRFSLDALLVGLRLIAHSQALRAPPVESL
jgi:hypothetical protein